MTTVQINSMLSADWHVPAHFKQIDGYATTQFGGTIKFGFICEECGDSFRKDYGAIKEFEESIAALVVWIDLHRHE